MNDAAEKHQVILPRKTADGPWCWQSKAARRAIRDAFDASNNVASALGVYDALTEEASNKKAQTFATTHAWLQSLSGVSVSTIKKVLRVFVEMNLVHVSLPEFRAPSTYTLLPFPLANGCLTPLANGSQCGSLATLEEQEKGERMREQPIAPPGAVVVLPGKSLPLPKPKQASERTPLLDALASLNGSDPAQATSSQRGAIATALGQILDVCPHLTPEEIARRADHYRQHMPTAMLTAAALAKHWATCDHPPAPRNNHRVGPATEAQHVKGF